MPRKVSSTPTQVELQILNVFWERGPSTVRELHVALASERETGYSTTLKMVQVMSEKGLLLRDDTVRPQVYRPAQTQETIELQLLDDLILRGFGGSAKSLLLRAVSAKRISPAELTQIKQLLNQAKEKK